MPASPPTSRFALQPTFFYALVSALPKLGTRVITCHMSQVAVSPPPKPLSRHYEPCASQTLGRKSVLSRITTPGCKEKLIFRDYMFRPTELQIMHARA